MVSGAPSVIVSFVMTAVDGAAAPDGLMTYGATQDLSPEVCLKPQKTYLRTCLKSQRACLRLQSRLKASGSLPKGSESLPKASESPSGSSESPSDASENMLEAS